MRLPTMPPATAPITAPITPPTGPATDPASVPAAAPPPTMPSEVETSIVPLSILSSIAKWCFDRSMPRQRTSRVGRTTTYMKRSAGPGRGSIPAPSSCLLFREESIQPWRPRRDGCSFSLGRQRVCAVPYTPLDSAAASPSAAATSRMHGGASTRLGDRRGRMFDSAPTIVAHGSTLALGPGGAARQGGEGVAPPLLSRTRRHRSPREKP